MPSECCDEYKLIQLYQKSSVWCFASSHTSTFELIPVLPWLPGAVVTVLMAVVLVVIVVVVVVVVVLVVVVVVVVVVVAAATTTS